MLCDELNEPGNVLRPGPTPAFSDVEVVALAPTAEYLSINSENTLFKKIQADCAEGFPTLRSRPQSLGDPINRRKQVLFPLIERLRQRLVAPFIE